MLSPQYGFRIYLIATSALMCFAVGRYVYQYSHDVLLSTLIFTTFIYSELFCFLRQWIAMSFIIFAIEMLNKNKNGRFLFLILVATSFHYSAAVCIIFIVFKNINVNTKNSLLVVAISFVSLLAYSVVYRVLTQLFPVLTIYSRYFNTQGNFQRVFTLPNIIIIASCIYLIITLHHTKFIIQWENSGTNFSASRSIYYYSVFAYLLIAILSTNVNSIYRLRIYFSLPYVIVLPSSLVVFTKKTRSMIYPAIVAAFLFFFFSSQVIGSYQLSLNRNGRLTPNTLNVYPYHYFWETNFNTGEFSFRNAE
jgi:hypothetical protein